MIYDQIILSKFKYKNLDFVGSTRKDCDRGSVFRLGFGFGWDKEVAPRPPRVKLDEREVFFVSLEGSIVFRLLE